MGGRTTLGYLLSFASLSLLEFPKHTINHILISVYFLPFKTTISFKEQSEYFRYIAAMHVQLCIVRGVRGVEHCHSSNVLLLSTETALV